MVYDSPDPEQPVVIYTDGCCNKLGNGGAAMAIHVGEELWVSSRPLWAATTQRAELIAGASALNVVKLLDDNKAPGARKIFSDSQYVINGMTKYLTYWAMNGWMTKGSEKYPSQPIKHKDVWENAFKIGVGRAEWYWVKGHSGIFGNELCDGLAEQARTFCSAYTAQDEVIWGALVKAAGLKYVKEMLMDHGFSTAFSQVKWL